MSSRTRLSEGGGEQGAAAVDEATGRLRGDFASVDEAARTALGRVFADEVMAGRESGSRLLRRGHKTAVGVIASAEKFAQTAVGDVLPSR